MEQFQLHFESVYSEQLISEDNKLLSKLTKILLSSFLHVETEKRQCQFLEELVGKLQHIFHQLHSNNSNTSIRKKELEFRFFYRLFSHLLVHLLQNSSSSHLLNAISTQLTQLLQTVCFPLLLLGQISTTLQETALIAMEELLSNDQIVLSNWTELFQQFIRQSINRYVTGWMWNCEKKTYAVGISPSAKNKKIFDEDEDISELISLLICYSSQATCSSVQYPSGKLGYNNNFLSEDIVRNNGDETSVLEKKEAVGQNIRYAPVCRLVEICLNCRNMLCEDFLSELSGIVKVVIMSGCSDLRRIVSTTFLTTLISNDSNAIVDIASSLNLLWQQSIGLDVEEQVSYDMLNILCELAPRNPSLLDEVKLQEFLQRGLRNKNDPVVRKKSLFILKNLLSHYEKKSTELDQKKQFDTYKQWEHFISLYETIDFHKEKHLIDQIVPDLNKLLVRNFFDSVPRHVRPAVVCSSPDFDWISTIYCRAFHHTNPVVRRSLLISFLECLNAEFRQRKGQSISFFNSSDHKLSCQQKFVLNQLFNVLNDPLMHKNKKYNVEGLSSEFLVQFIELHIDLKDAGKVNYFLNEYISHIEQEFFSKNSCSPEALNAVFSVFLSQLWKCSDHGPVFSLNNASVEKISIMLDEHALRSFPQSFQKYLLRCSLELMINLIDPTLIQLNTLARFVHVFPMNCLFSSLSQYHKILKWMPQCWLKDGLTTSLKERKISPLLAVKLFLLCEDNNCHVLKSENSRALTQNEYNVISDVIDRHSEIIYFSTPVATIFSTEHENEFQQVEFLVELILILRSYTSPFGKSSFLDIIGKELAISIFHKGLDVWRKVIFDQTPYAEDTKKLQKYMQVMIFLALFLAIEDSEEACIEELDSHFKRFMSSVKQANLIEAVKFEIIHAFTMASRESYLIEVLDSLDCRYIVPIILQLTINKHDNQNSSLLGAFTNSKWELVTNLIESEGSLSSNVRNIYGQINEILPLKRVNNSLVKCLFRSLSRVLYRFVDSMSSDKELQEKELHKVFSNIWTAYKNANKQRCLSNLFIACLFPVEVFLEFPNLFKANFYKVIKYAESKRPNVMYHLATRLCMLLRNFPNTSIEYVDEVLYLVLYKEPVLDEKEEAVYLNNSQSIVKKSCRSGDWMVRYIVLSFLKDLPSFPVINAVDDVKNCGNLARLLIFDLLKKNQQQLWKKPHMINSAIFGQKLRSWQALCVLSKYITEKDAILINEMLWNDIFVVMAVPSIRYYMEVFAIRLVQLFPESTIVQFMIPFLSNFHLPSQIAVSGLLVSGMILPYLAKFSPHDLLKDVIRAMLPWLNSAHGHSRLVVQFLIYGHLDQYLEELKLSKQSHNEEIQFLLNMRLFLEENKECKRMLLRQKKQMAQLEVDRLASFDGIFHCTEMNEFFEVYPVASFTQQIKNVMTSVYNEFLLLEQKKLSAYNSLDNSQSNTHTTTNTNIQRKIEFNLDTPTDESLDDGKASSDFLNNLEFEITQRMCNTRARSRQSMVVCASFVDKLPNLAGLARTCEIFNAEELLVPNHRITEELLFQQISVTANKWMPMKEVIPDIAHVKAVLKEYQRRGYQLVGLEQSSQSKCLQDFSFPEKIVIVLGKEKEGIPVEILQMLDICIEIPQLGIIRSLNVHVSGAILMWQYTQQQLKQ